MNKEHLLRVAINIFEVIKKHEPCDSEKNKMQEAIDNKNIIRINRLFLNNASWLTNKNIKIPNEYLELDINAVYDFDDPRISELPDWEYVDQPDLSNPFGDYFDDDDLTNRIDEVEQERNDAIAELIVWLDEQEKEPDPSGLEIEVLNNLAELTAMLEALNSLSDELPRYFACYRQDYLDENWAEEEMESCGYLDKDTPSILRNNIDWSGLLDDLLTDYTDIDVFGEEYMYQER